MKTTRLICFLSTSLAMFAVPATAQTPDGMTPAQETVCDDANFVTPGLYGLCVAFCEAQDCKATVDSQGVVTLDESCKPSSEQLLANYDRKNRKNGNQDPPMPCIEVECPCWTEPQLNAIGGSGDRCTSSPYVSLVGKSTNENAMNRTEGAYAMQIFGAPACTRVEWNPGFTWIEQTDIGNKAFAKCQQSILDECAARGITTP